MRPLNPLPFQVGGGATSSERAYAALRQAVGVGGSAPNDRGIEGLWRRSEAIGLAAATSSTRRAINNAFPHLATDLLPYYERMLGLVPMGAEAERRGRVVPRWTKRGDNATPVLAEVLTAIDARLSLVEVPHDQEAVSQYGRAFAAHEEALEQPVFGLARGHCLAPCYSTDSLVRVLFAVGHTGPLTSSELGVVEETRRALRETLPSTSDFVIAIDDGLGAPGLWHLGSTPIGFGGCS